MAEKIITIILSSQILLWLMQFLITRHFSKKDDLEEIKNMVKKLSKKDACQDETISKHTKQISIISQTTGALTYKALSDLIKSALNSGFATAGDRKVIKEINQAYHSNGYNGDFDDAIREVEKLPYSLM